MRAETRFFTALLPVTACTVRGLPPLRPQFQLLVPRIPARLLDAVLADARRARRPDNGLNEVLYQFHHHGRAVQVKKPAQQTTPTSVATSVTTAVADAGTICDLHSHGNMRAFFSQADNADGQSARLYAVISSSVYRQLSQVKVLLAEAGNAFTLRDAGSKIPIILAPSFGIYANRVCFGSVPNRNGPQNQDTLEASQLPAKTYLICALGRVICVACRKSWMIVWLQGQRNLFAQYLFVSVSLLTRNTAY